MRAFRLDSHISELEPQDGTLEHVAQFDVAVDFLENLRNSDAWGMVPSCHASSASETGLKGLPSRPSQFLRLHAFQWLCLLLDVGRAHVFRLFCQ